MIGLQNQIRTMLGYGLYVSASIAGAKINNGLPDFFVQLKPPTAIENVNSSLQDLEQFVELQKKNRYVGEDQPLEEHSFLHNDFFQNDHLRIYNHTQYNFDAISDHFSPTQIQQLILNDLSISLGYGMEFRLQHNQRWGYEYLSSFPYDRGQSIRFYWRYYF